MNHDKLCRCANCHHPRETECDCAVIEATRADEREQAAQRVAALDDLTGYDLDGLVEQSAAVAAARGEDEK